jgi:pRiA4b ORF-3-like protein
MPWKKLVGPGEKVGLKLTAAERTLLLEELNCLPPEYERGIRSTETSKPIMLTLDELDDLGGSVAAEANHIADKKLQKKLDTVFEKIQHLLETYTDEQPVKTLKIGEAKKDKVVADGAAALTAFAAKALAAAEQLEIKNKPVEHFWLAPAQRDVLLLVSGLSKTIKSKLATPTSSFTVAEVASMTMALAGDLGKAEAPKRLAMLLVAKHLMDRLQEGIIGSAKPRVRKGKEPTIKTNAKTLLQFKVILQDTHPPIWRRIQVKDCTLDKLHEYIQTAMGWTNSHLHKFEIGGLEFADPMLMEEDFEEFGYRDSTTTKLSDILPKDDKRFNFRYEYDFGDGWEHEILFEGLIQAAPGFRYPICVEGSRACPPEDVGGTGGYEEFLEAIANPSHEEHDEMLKWSGPFDPDAFDAGEATKRMKKGLPNWREER